jgi:diaminohydroxyphosphoribosylaminopyrimidine deaminase/5-amino-6-(5-phosphoribosylamino)uracil reductase
MNIEKDQYWMRQALDLAQQGEGAVEPNPMVGCVLVANDDLIGHGFHQQFGGPHAEVNALRNAQDSGHSPRGATAFVTLEPCSHSGKTGPCAEALISAGVRRVVVGQTDPFPDVSGKGIARLKEAGIEVDVGVLQSECRELNAPYLKRIESQTPWLIAKWAMTLDGKLATQSGDSRWITNSESRQLVQQLRGRVDAIMVGANTPLADAPMLTARPADKQSTKRIAMRVVCDSLLRIAPQSQLVTTAKEVPVLIACGPDATEERADELRNSGCEIWRDDSACRNARIVRLLTELASRGMTNVLVEGGSQLMGSLHDQALIDELHLWIGPKLFGNASATTPVAGNGIEKVADAAPFNLIRSQTIDNDQISIQP